MFEPFPDRYVWNLAVNLALAVGGEIGETDRACTQLRHLDSTADDDDRTEAFFEAWCSLADTLVSVAQDDQAARRTRSAAHKYARAAVYYQTAERMQAHSFAPRKEAYRKALDCFTKSIELGEPDVRRVEIPYGNTSLPGILTTPPGVSSAPCVIFWNGLDSTKEQIFGSGAPHELRARGIASLVVDTPGSGEALRLRGLTAQRETEPWATACIDYLENLPDVDSDLIGLVAWSLGGYYGPRATAFESRIRFGVAWGANYDWGEVQRQRLAREGARPVPHYWEHVKWVWGVETIEEFMELSQTINLRGVAERINVPYLVVHGEHDRQIDLKYARLLYEDMAANPRRELKIFTDREGGVEHCSVDNMPVVRDYICDWIAATVDDVRRAS